MSTDYNDKLAIAKLKEQMLEVEIEQAKLKAALEELRDQLIKNLGMEVFK